MTLILIVNYSHVTTFKIVIPITYYLNRLKLLNAWLLALSA